MTFQAIRQSYKPYQPSIFRQPKSGSGVALRFGEENKTETPPVPQPNPNAAKTPWFKAAIAPVLAIMAVGGAGFGIKTLVDADIARSERYANESKAREAKREADGRARLDAERRSDILRLELQHMKDPLTKMTILMSRSNDSNPYIRSTLIKLALDITKPAENGAFNAQAETMKFELLKKLATDSDVGVRYDVAYAAGNGGLQSDTHRTELLNALYNDPSSSVRKAVATSSQTLQQDPVKFKILSTLVLDMERDVRQAAMEATGSLQSEALKRELFLKVMNQK